MHKLLGFTAIEVLVVMTIMGILAVITIPNFTRQRAENQFNSQVKDVFDTISDARANALSEKKCGDGSTSYAWIFSISQTDPQAGFSLLCNDEDGADEIVISRDFKENILGVVITPTFTDNSETKAKIEFLSGTSQVKINNDFSTVNIKMVFTHPPTDSEKTICLSRVSAFPTISNDGECAD